VTGVASVPGPDSGYAIERKAGQTYIVVYYKNKMHEMDIIIEGAGRNSIREKVVAEIFRFILDIVAANDVH